MNLKAGIDSISVGDIIILFNGDMYGVKKIHDIYNGAIFEVCAKRYEERFGLNLIDSHELEVLDNDSSFVRDGAIDSFIQPIETQYN